MFLFIASRIRLFSYLSIVCCLDFSVLRDSDIEIYLYTVAFTEGIRAIYYGSMDAFEVRQWVNLEEQ